MVNISSSVYRYWLKPDNDEALRHRLRELGEQRKRFGSTRLLHILLKREGLVINHKRTERIYHEEELTLRRKRRRKGAAGARVSIPSPQRTNERWSMEVSSQGSASAPWRLSMTIPGNTLLSKLIHPWVVAESWVCWKGYLKSGDYRRSSPSITDRSLPVVPWTSGLIERV